MGRTIIADERVYQSITELTCTKDWTVGLLIGQVTEQRDYVVHIVCTPEADTNVKAEQRGGLDTVDEGWVCTHARQVLKMLPGGLDIVGVFAMATMDVLKTSQLQLRKVLFSVQKTVNKSEADSGSIHHDRVLLTIGLHTKKMACRTFDTTDVKSTARPAEWKIQSFLSNWVALESSLTVDQIIPVSTHALSQTLNKQIQAGLVPLVTSVRNSLALVNGELRDPEAPVSTALAQTQKAGPMVGRIPCAEARQESNVCIELLLQLQGDESGDVTMTTCGAQMRICGTITSRAFVHGKATVSEAIQAVKTDVVRSLTARCNLLCEDLLQAEEEQDPRVLYETPVRIHAAVTQSPICFCDYMFQDETPADSLDRFRDLLGLVLLPEQLEMEMEHIPSKTDLLLMARADSKEDFREPSTSATNLKGRNFIGAVLGGVVAIMAAGISYMYSVEV